jgi:hypothetical protein
MAGRCRCLIDRCSARTFGSILTYLWFIPGTSYSAEAYPIASCYEPVFFYLGLAFARLERRVIVIVHGVAFP